MDGRNVHYIDQGDGPAVLLLHGWGAPAQTYRLIIDHLSAYCRASAGPKSRRSHGMRGNMPILPPILPLRSV